LDNFDVFIIEKLDSEVVNLLVDINVPRLLITSVMLALVITLINKAIWHYRLYTKRVQAKGDEWSFFVDERSF